MDQSVFCSGSLEFSAKTITPFDEQMLDTGKTTELFIHRPMLQDDHLIFQTFSSIKMIQNDSTCTFPYFSYSFPILLDKSLNFWPQETDNVGVVVFGDDRAIVEGAGPR